MSYTKFVAAIARANSGNVNKIRISPGRCRSTLASTKKQEEKEQQMDGCPVVEAEPVELISQTKNITNTKLSKIHIDFDNTQEAYRSKGNIELLRSLLVFKLCTIDVLVEKNKELMDLSKKLFGQWMFEKMMKMTFYGQFVAGEDHNSIKPLIHKNQAFGVGAVLDYSVEEDLTQEEAEKKEMDSCVSEAEKESPGADHREKKYKAHRQFGDRRGGVTSARTYFYADESKCDTQMETFINCIKASGGASADGFSAIKMTALGRPQFLLQFSEVLVKWRQFFNYLAAQQGKSEMMVLEQKLELEQLKESLTKMGVGAKDDIENWFTGEKLGLSGTIDLLDWNSLINDTTKISSLLMVPNLETRQLEPLLNKFTAEEEKQMKRMLQRVDVLAKHAMENGVRLMVDAEQTYFQPAISRLTLEMQRIFNREKPIIFNTYQCYLKEAYDNVTMDIELSRREGWYFGAKLVRGAYMYQERDRAKEIGYEDPINPDYEATNRMYHKCLEYVLEEIEHRRKANIMVASHNEDTVKFTLEKMNEMGLSPTENKVYFGQLLGMCDQISFPLGQAGFPVYKYVPYGPVNEVIPYLSRRAQENRGFMKGSQRERSLLWTELKRRMLAGQIFYKPVY
ncbi:Proline dehydrogenase 1, mitochondrial [Larimichthys crocea]|uniref:Proline dehydrogenase n=1 Tax=Larimichthys crocea TaxID=215358 RepID=A0A6G0I158_LARCR|nr:proline dehydrogenase 1, mitochondrial isoform X1 [Larimichthys crocea]XP_019134371.1 proline dehydrogenase 1, mitochondrial isoform X2 [Larimichthys crocea]KAE8285077.1 Proline dehydrogenase 1, mitochondrial [Larimichthys crocea]